MPFHSVKTEEEAKSLVIRYCRLGYDMKNYLIRRDWREGDILAAMQSAKRQFQLEVKDD